MIPTAAIQQAASQPANRQCQDQAGEYQGQGRWPPLLGHIDLATHLPGRLVHDLRGDLNGTTDAGTEQGPITQNIDEPGHPAGEGMDTAHRRGRKQGPLHPSHRQAMADIVTGLPGVQGLEVKTGGDALVELAQPRAGQQAAQLRLPHQEDLQQLLLGGFRGW